MGYFHGYIPNLENECNKEQAKYNSMFFRIHLQATVVAISPKFGE